MDAEQLKSVLLSVDAETDKFKQLLLSVDRPGITDLFNWLQSTDFFIAPASTRFHLSRPGGLLTHSLNVFYWFLSKSERLGFGIPADSLILTALLHDVCKIQTYVDYGKGGAYGYNKHEGHGSRSVKLVTQFVKLTPLEERMVFYHMGTFGEEYNPQRYHAVISNCPLIAVFAITDHESSLLEQAYKYPKDGEIVEEFSGENNG